MSEDLERSTYTFNWSIENFSLCSQALGECIQSPVFLVEILDCSEFYLSLFPRGETKINVLYCNFYRAEEDCGPEKVEFDFSLSLCVKKELKETIYRDRLQAGRNCHLIQGFEKQLNDLFDESGGFLPNDTLTVQCCLTTKVSKNKSSKMCYAKTLIQAEKHSFVVPWIFSQFSTSSTSDASFKDCFFNIRLHSYSEHGKFEFKISYCLDLLKKGQIKIRRTTADGKKELTKNKLLVVFKAFREDVDKVIVCGEQMLPAGKDKWEVSFSVDESHMELKGEKFPVRWDFAISDGKYTTTSLKVVHDYSEVLHNSNYHYETGKNSFLKSMFDDKKFCDVTLRVEDTNFPAHKCALSACSPIFNSMFDSDMKEKETGIVEISDITKETLELLLSFIYTGDIADLQQKSAVELYVAADKYQILELKKICSLFIKANLSDENVCHVLDMADFYRDTDLELKARNYISSHTNIFATDEWKSFMEKRLQLAADVMVDLCKKNLKND